MTQTRKSDAATLRAMAQELIDSNRQRDDLLEVCKAALAWIKEFGFEQTELEVAQRELIESMDAAIAKAEGKSDA
jgi:hypothetical protein